MQQKIKAVCQQTRAHQQNYRNCQFDGYKACAQLAPAASRGSTSAFLQAHLCLREEKVQRRTCGEENATDYRDRSGEEQEMDIEVKPLKVWHVIQQVGRYLLGENL